jgi:hypothetical protein
MCDAERVQASFGIVLFVVVAGAAIVGLVTFAGARRMYDEIGKGGLSLRDGSDRPAHEPTGAAASAVREAEIRQLLTARNARRARRGEPQADVEAELAELLRPAIDPGIEAEVRGLVIARNARRARRGEAPLDVEAEVARQLAELG